MYTYIVEYVTDLTTLALHTMLVSADDYSKAYISALVSLPFGAMITEVAKI